MSHNNMSLTNKISENTLTTYAPYINKVYSGNMWIGTIPLTII